MNKSVRSHKTRKIEKRKRKKKSLSTLCFAMILSKNSALNLNFYVHLLVSILEDELVAQYDETEWEGNDNVNLIDSGMELQLPDIF